MQHLIRLVYILLALAISPTSLAKELELTLWGLSHHTQAPPQGRAWNEINPGLGMRLYLEPHDGIEPFMQADYIVRNSKNGSLVLVGGGAQYSFLHMRHMSVVAGVVAGIARYENAWTDEVLYFPGGYPFVGVRRHATTASLGYIPEFRDKDGKQGGVFIFTLSFRL